MNFTKKKKKNCRVKRQGPGFGGGFQNPFHGSSQSTAQSDSHSNSFGPQGFGNANALAGAQGQSHLFSK